MIAWQQLFTIHINLSFKKKSPVPTFIRTSIAVKDLLYMIFRELDKTITLNHQQTASWHTPILTSTKATDLLGIQLVKANDLYGQVPDGIISDYLRTVLEFPSAFSTNSEIARREMIIPNSFILYTIPISATA
jgi:hypothetical protein